MKRNYIILALCLPLSGLAQLKVYPLEQRTAAPASQTKPSARTSADAISLPFWDDFSFTKDNYPVDTLWISPTSKSVWISDGQGINPPTINVATFDGLKADGTPYSPASDNLDFGYRDTLESQPIKMTEVTLPFRDSVFLSFFYQWAGNGEAPDANDFLRLEFKNVDDEWDEIALFKTQNILDPTVFNSYTFRINQNKYYHDEFQFRFISFGRKSGRYDAWHIDYVYLNRRGKFELDNTSVNDRAMTIPFTSVLGEYFSMPYTHFKSNFLENFTYPSYELNNLKGNADPQPTNYTTYFTITHFINNIPTIAFDDFVEIEASSPITDIPSLTRLTFPVGKLPDTLKFDLDADTVKIFVKIGANSGDNEEDYFLRYDPINFLLNDTLTHTFDLSDYYAYDDGIAEYSAGNIQAYNQLAYRFDMKTDQKDTINGLSIHFPIFAGISSGNVVFFIMESLNGEPNGEPLYTQSISILQNNNNEFIYTALDAGVPVKGSFFVGYTEPVTGHVRIGLDRRNNTGDRMYYRANSSVETWSLNNDEIRGSLMIRPHFGKANIVVGLPEVESDISILFYPNPNAGEFYAKGNTRIIGIHRITGETVAFSSEELDGQIRITLTNPVSGFYIVRYQNGAGVSFAKICVK